MEERHAAELKALRHEFYEQLNDVRQCSGCISPSPPPPTPSPPPPPPSPSPPPPRVLGCLTPEASNFDSLATENDGSCVVWSPPPTTPPPAQPPTPCVYTVTGCTDSAAGNYLPIANEDDGGCIFPVYGCTIANGTLNYDSTATVLHGCENERTGAYTLG